MVMMNGMSFGLAMIDLTQVSVLSSFCISNFS